MREPEPQQSRRYRIGDLVEVTRDAKLTIINQEGRSVSVSLVKGWCGVVVKSVSRSKTVVRVYEGDWRRSRATLSENGLRDVGGLCFISDASTLFEVIGSRNKVFKLKGHKASQRGIQPKFYDPF